MSDISIAGGRFLDLLFNFYVVGCMSTAMGVIMVYNDDD